MKKETYTDEQIVEMISRSGTSRDRALRFLFLNWRGVAKGVLMASHNALSTADADDAIQEAVVVLDNNIRSGKYQHQGNLRTYFIGICKGRLYSNRRSTKRIDWTDDNRKMDDIEEQHPETLMLKEEKKSVLFALLKTIDPKCREVLKFYRLSYSMKEIAEETDLKNDNTARQWVFKCRKRLIEAAGKNPGFQNYFN